MHNLEGKEHQLKLDLDKAHRKEKHDKMIA